MNAKLNQSPALAAPHAEELLARYGSPLYVYDGGVLRAAVERITRAVPYRAARFYFAGVTNGSLALLRIFRGCGWGLHANTPGDVYLGLRAGFAPEQIVFSGGNLSRDEMRQVLDLGVGAINLDSLSQLELLCRLSESCASQPRLGFRLNLPAVTGESRTGVRPEELSEAVRIAARRGLRVGGIHFYRGTGTNATDAFTESIAAVIAVGRSLPDWEYLDFGGGFGHPYRAGQAGFGWEEFGAELSRQLGALERPVELFIEPGRAAVAGCGVLLTRVVSVKWQGAKQVAGVDTTVGNIAVLSVHGGYREIRAVSARGGEEGLYLTDVCGNTTFSRDYLGRGCKLPALAEGDVLAILDVGAYGYAMSSHFLHRPRPAEVLIEGGAHRLIRRREGYEVLIDHQIDSQGDARGGAGGGGE
jgi:diaminopimelate decarboxylase